MSEYRNFEEGSPSASLDFLADIVLGRHYHEIHSALVPMTILRTRFKTINREHLIRDGIQEAWLRGAAGRLPALLSLAQSLHVEFERFAREHGELETDAALSHAIAHTGDETPLGRAMGELLMYISTVAGNCAGDERKTEARRGARWTSNPERTLVYSDSGEGVVALGDSYHIPHATELTALAKARLESSTNLYLSHKPGLAAATKRYICAFVELVLLAGESLDSAMELLEGSFGPPPLSRMNLWRTAKGVRALMNGVA